MAGRKSCALAASVGAHGARTAARCAGFHSREREAKIAALAYLTNAADPSLLPVIRRQAQDWDGQIRIAAVRGLAVLDRQAAGRLLLREFDTRFVGGCLAATDALKTLTGRARDVDCYDPASRRDAKAHWTAVIARLQ